MMLMMTMTVECRRWLVRLRVQSERARKNAEAGLNEATSRINELTVSITSVSGERRRFEADMASLQAEYEETLRGRRDAEDRADRLQMELNRVMEELRREQENYKNAESIRKSLEVEIREISVKLEEAESFAQREGKRLIAKLQARVSTPACTLHVLKTIIISLSVSLSLCVSLSLSLSLSPF